MPSSRGAEARRHGRQEPRLRIEPERAYTDGEDAAELVSAYGYDLDPWQRLVIDAWLGRDASDLFTATSCGLAVPRQNGKNALLEVRELYGLVCNGEKFLHTAHEVRTARKAFLRLASFFENDRQHPELAAMVVFIRKANGQEAISLTNGGLIEFSARTRGAARGFTVDTVVFDEAQELTDEQMEAILPTLAAAPSGNRQFIYTGTPPGPGSPGEVFKRTRKTAVDGADPSMSWHEWSVEELPDASIDPDGLVELAWDTNPAMGYRLDAEFCRKEATSMSLDGFARERLGWWSPESTAARPLIDPKKWKAREVGEDEAMRDGKLAYGVKFSPDGSSAALSVALTEKNGPAYVELIDCQGTSRGTDGLAEWLVERADRCAALAIDGKSGASALAKRLIDRGFPRKALIECRASDAQAAASMIVDEVNAGTVTHIESPALDASATKSIRRQIGLNGGFGFGDGPDSIATPVESAALALWASRTSRRDPRRKQVAL